MLVSNDEMHFIQLEFQIVGIFVRGRVLERKHRPSKCKYGDMFLVPSFMLFLINDRLKI